MYRSKRSGGAVTVEKIRECSGEVGAWWSLADLR
jgi:hypothetical protein